MEKQDYTESPKNKREIKKVGNFSPTNHYGKDVFSTDGISPTLCSGSLVKNGLNIIEKEIVEKNIKDNFTEVEKGKYVTADKEKENCYAITTPPRTMPLHKKIDNYVLEKINNDPIEKSSETKSISLLNGAEDNTVIANIDANYSKGIAPADVKKKRNRRTHIIENIYASNQRDGKRKETSISPTLTEAMGMGGGHIPMLKIRETTKKGYKEAYPNDGVLLDRAGRMIAKGIVQSEATGTLKTSPAWGTVTKDYRIRKLTPTECERLQGFPDGWTEFGADGEKISDTQRYKTLGNAVTTTVITYLINEMFGGLNDESG